MEFLSDPSHGDELDASLTMYPTVLRVSKKPDKAGIIGGTTYGYVLEGRAVVRSDSFGSLDLIEGSFFSIPNRVRLARSRIVPTFTVVTITRLGYQGQSTIGRLEHRGRLSYIDGCSDSMLVYPPRMGDPCLNYLHFPPGILQTQHTHPTIRMGIVARGRGKAWKKSDGRDAGWEKDLSTGGVFLLHEQELHSFKTQSDIMDIVAYHPDSDWGPTDQNHPMLNRTYINHGT